MKHIIVGKDCTDCKYCVEEDKNHIRCEFKEKVLVWGMSVPCEDKEKKNV